MSSVRSLQIIVSLVPLFWFGPVLASVCAFGEGNTAIRSTTPSSDFTVHDDGTVTHAPTGLMWKRCSEGQSWNPDALTCDDTRQAFDWAEALATADGHSFAGYTDWRLPNRNELSSLVEERCPYLTLNTEIFPQASAATYWTASPFGGQGYWDSWVVEFSTGTMFNRDRSQTSAVRLVRTPAD